MTTSPQALSWKQPVKFEIPAGGSHKVTGPREALHWLDERWPLASGTAFDHARQECRLAQKSSENLENARSSFVAAAIEAFMIVRE